MPTWPVTLPQLPLQDGFSEKRPKNVIRTSMDQGKAKTRRRYTAGVRNFTVQLFMTTAQVAIFDAFQSDECYDNAISFTWVSPRTGESGSFRIVDEPSFVPKGPNWIVSFAMEKTG